jgi:hypothetical protein
MWLKQRHPDPLHTKQLLPPAWPRYKISDFPECRPAANGWIKISKARLRGSESADAGHQLEPACQVQIPIAEPDAALRSDEAEENNKARVTGFVR